MMHRSDPLFNRGFLSLLTTQFLGAANDNILKQCLTFMIATGIWSGSLSEGGLGEGGQIVPALCLTLPFILLSGYAGQLSDRFSKRQVIVAVKLAELPITLIALVGFVQQNLWLILLALLLLSVQSTFFGPAKYGVIPELVREAQLSRANGVLNMLTNLAVITGSLAAGPLSDLFDPRSTADTAAATPILWAPGAALVLLALGGIASVFLLPPLQAGNAQLRYTINPFATYVTSLREMARGPLLTVALAWSTFYMIGMIALMIVPEYEEILQISYTQTSYLLGILGIAIAMGSMTAGLLSGHRIRVTLVPIGAMGMSTFFLLLGLMPPTYLGVAIQIFGTGFFAGFYIVPLQALLQYLSPTDERGRFLGTANALSFCFSSAGALIFWLAINSFGLPANRVHLICAGLAIAGTGIGLVRMRQLQAA